MRMPWPLLVCVRGAAGNGASQVASLKLQIQDLSNISFLTSEPMAGKIQVTVLFWPQNLPKIGEKCPTRISDYLQLC